MQYLKSNLLLYDEQFKTERCTALKVTKSYHLRPEKFLRFLQHDASIS